MDCKFKQFDLVTDIRKPGSQFVITGFHTVLSLYGEPKEVMMYECCHNGDPTWINERYLELKEEIVMDKGKEFLKNLESTSITDGVLQDLSTNAEKLETALKMYKFKVAANKIWDICKESPEMGNAVMDLIGDEAYKRVMMFKNMEE